MISWLELNHLNAPVKTATDALMLLYKKLGKCSESFYGALV